LLFDELAEFARKHITLEVDMHQESWEDEVVCRVAAYLKNPETAQNVLVGRAEETLRLHTENRG
jgi:hypothetical protein